jgi:hypothetical protein
VVVAPGPLVVEDAEVVVEVLGEPVVDELVVDVPSVVGTVETVTSGRRSE